MLNKLTALLVTLCLLLLAACSPAATATPRPTEEPLPTDTPKIVPTEAPKATQAPQDTTTGVEALDMIVAENMPVGCSEFGVKYEEKDATGMTLDVYYPIQDFWTLLGMLKVSYASFIKEAPLLFEADPNLDYLTVTFQKPADSEKQEVGPQPVLIMEVSRDNVAKITSDLRWCELKDMIDKVEMIPEAADSWRGFCAA